MLPPAKRIKNSETNDNVFHTFRATVTYKHSNFLYPDILDNAEKYKLLSDENKKMISDSIILAKDIHGYKKLLEMGYRGDIKDMDYAILASDDYIMMTLLLKNGYMANNIINVIVEKFATYNISGIIKGCFRHLWDSDKSVYYKLPIAISTLDKLIAVNEKMAILVIETIKPPVDEIRWIVRNALLKSQKIIFEYFFNNKNYTLNWIEFTNTETFNQITDIHIKQRILNASYEKNSKIIASKKYEEILSDEQFLEKCLLPKIAGDKVLLSDMKQLKDDHLKLFSDKKNVYIRCCPNITDAGIKHLVNVETLAIRCENVTGTCFSHLTSLKKFALLTQIWGKSNYLTSSVMLSLLLINYPEC